MTSGITISEKEKLWVNIDDASFCKYQFQPIGKKIYFSY